MALALETFKNRYDRELNVLTTHGELIGDWSNVYDHCLTEGLVASVFADLLKLDADDREALVKAALLHDWYKRKEREAAGQHGASQYDAAALRSAEGLKSLGYSERIAELTASVGHTSLKAIEATDDFLRKLMHYIDDMVLQKTVIGLRERVQRTWAKDQYRELNESGRAVFGGKTYAQVQEEVGLKIERQVARRLGCAPGEVMIRVKDALKETYQINS